MKKVEKFRLTKEQAGHMKAMKRINDTKELLAKGPLQRWKDEGEMIKQAFNELDQQQQMIQLSAPEEKTLEIPGQTNDEGRELFDSEQGQQMQQMQQGLEAI